jgi:A/G-specific adenine glycosylase
VAIGVVRRPARVGWEVLISLRLQQAVLGGLWEFPGGKIHPGESPQQAVRRELSEELGIQVVVEAPILCIEHVYAHGLVRLQAFYCRIEAGLPRAEAVAAWRWVAADDLARYAFPHANAPLTEEIAGQLGAWG